MVWLVFLVIEFFRLFFRIWTENSLGPAGFEPAISSARGWHHTKLDNGPKNFVFLYDSMLPYYKILVILETEVYLDISITIQYLVHYDLWIKKINCFFAIGVVYHRLFLCILLIWSLISVVLLNSFPHDSHLGWCACSSSFIFMA